MTLHLPVSPDESTRTQWQNSAAPATGQDSSPGPSPVSSVQRRRSLFWPAFALGFLLLGAVSCGSLAIILGLDRLSLAEIRGSTDAWKPPPFVPSPTPAIGAQPPPSEPGAAPFVSGDQVRNITNSRVNLRRTPGYLSKPGGDVLALLQPGDALEILGEATAADGLTWWHVRYPAGGGQVVEGWVAEATASGVQILGKS